MMVVNVPELRSAASAYARERLQGEDILTIPPAKNLRVTVVVPVCGEPLRRLFELFESLAKQEGLEAGEMEIICVINTGTNDGSTAFHADKNANLLLLELPFWKNRSGFGAEQKFPEAVLKQARDLSTKLPLLAIDKSSDDHVFKTPSTGSARDRGLAEAVSRYLGLEKNGLVIFLDADVIVEDSRFIKRALDAFEKDTTMIAATGGLDFRFDPDALQPRERKRENRQIGQYLKLRKWQAMQQFFNKGEADLLPENAFIGANMLARAYEAAAWGGFQKIVYTSDAMFGKDGRAFARAHGGRIETLKDLRVSTALRYQHWMGREFDPADDEVRLPFTDEEFEALERYIGASTQGQAFLDTLANPAVLLYQNLHLD